MICGGNTACHSHKCHNTCICELGASLAFTADQYLSELPQIILENVHHYKKLTACASVYKDNLRINGQMWTEFSR